MVGVPKEVFNQLVDAAAGRGAKFDAREFASRQIQLNVHHEGPVLNLRITAPCGRKFDIETHNVSSPPRVPATPLEANAGGETALILSALGGGPQADGSTASGAPGHTRINGEAEGIIAASMTASDLHASSAASCAKLRSPLSLVSNPAARASAASGLRVSAPRPSSLSANGESALGLLPLPPPMQSSDDVGTPNLSSSPRYPIPGPPLPGLMPPQSDASGPALPSASPLIGGLAPGGSLAVAAVARLASQPASASTTPFLGALHNLSDGPSAIRLSSATSSDGGGGALSPLVTGGPFV
jgi:hypothetical protein